MTREILPVVRDGYTLSGTENLNEFYFYRNNFHVLDRIPTTKILELYQTYIMRKVQSGYDKGILKKELTFAISVDRRCVLITETNAV